METESLTLWILSEAERIGFDACGIAPAAALEQESARMEAWLEEDHGGEMRYLNRNKEKRYDPRLLVQGTRSILTVLYNYYPATPLPDHDNYKLAKYAYGVDYHEVVKNKLLVLLEAIEKRVGRLEGVRAFTDSAPILDRAWAVRCGLGFIGKNTALIHPKKGSFLFIGHLFLPIALEATGAPLSNRCGRCTRCLDACPTGALEAPFRIDARKCLSYLTIEFKGSLEGRDRRQFHDWMYGCDICQDVCPYNKKFAVANMEPLFQPSEALLGMRKKDWETLDRDTFDRLFKRSAVCRAGYEGLKRNISFLSE